MMRAPGPAHDLGAARYGWSMSRRHDRLVPLTHDHHHALRHARALARAADGDDDTALGDAAGTFLRAYEDELLVHFREEEEQLLPLLPRDDPEAQELTRRTLLDHIELHRLVHELRHHPGDVPDRDTVRTLATTLRGHIRMEEDRLFPLAKRIVADVDLETISLAPRHRTLPGPAPGV